MRSKMNFSMLVVTLAAVAALTFGASEAMAENAAVACRSDPPGFLGECVSPGQCNAECQAQVGSDPTSQGICDSQNCCVCFQ